MFYFSIYWECHHPNWRTHIFQRGRSTTNQILPQINLVQDIQNDVESFESFRLCFMSTVRIFSHSNCDGMHKFWPKTLGNSWFDWDWHLLLLTVSIEISWTVHLWKTTFFSEIRRNPAQTFRLTLSSACWRSTSCLIELRAQLLKITRYLPITVTV